VRPGRARSALRLAALVLGSAAAVGCVRGCTSSRPPIHLNPNMDYQPKLQAQEGSEFFYDGQGMRAPVEGTVARGRLNEDAAFQTGKDASGAFLAASPVARTDALLQRGAERYGIYCRPCHDPRGDGKGILFERAGVPTPSFHEERIRGLADGEIFDVVSHGKGLMPAYAYPIPPADRWAVIAHVRRLQQERQAVDVASAGRP
jgi:mono/diheme cytochrome c family protein